MTNALLSLIRAYGSIAGQIGGLQKTQRDLAEKLAAAVRDKALKLQEYREGLFCSGCNKTKSEILSRGEQFPHPGQTIIKPTEEQIARKERELQGIIDRLAEDLKKTRAKLAELEPDLTDIKDQIFAGMGLWRTATSFERQLIRQNDVYDAEAYFHNRTKIGQQLNSVQKRTVTAVDEPVLARGVADLENWIGTLKRVEADRGGELELVTRSLSENERTAREQVAQVDQAGKAEARKITAFGLGGYLEIVSVPMSPSIDPRPVVNEASGLTFRMGRYGKSSWGEILPNVAEFVGRARNMRMTSPRGRAMSAAVELSRADVALTKLKSRLATVQNEARQKTAAAGSNN